MKRLWIFILILWSKICIRLRTRKQRERARLNDAVMFGAEMERLWRLAERGDIGIDFVHALYNMSSKEYQDHVCNGAYTEPNAMKAHLYFGNIRTWINLQREKINNLQGTELLPLEREDPIVWGVANDEGKLYLTGTETRTKFEVHPVDSELENSTKTTKTKKKK